MGQSKPASPTNVELQCEINLHGGDDSKLSDSEAVDELHDVDAEEDSADEPEPKGAHHVRELSQASVQLAGHRKSVNPFPMLKS